MKLRYEIIIIAMIALSLTAYLTINKTVDTLTLNYHKSLNINISASYNILVYRNGQLKYNVTKHGDPVTKWFYYMLADNTFLLGTGKPVTWYTTTYNEAKRIDTDYGGIDPQPLICIGDGYGTASVNDYNMFGLVANFTPSNIIVTTTPEYIQVQVIGTYIATSSFNLTEIGYALLVDISVGSVATLSGSYNYLSSWTLGQAVYKQYILVAHDNVQAIPIKPDDTIQITYYFQLPYAETGPFTHWFYNYIIMYMLGGKYLGLSDSFKWSDASTTTTIDLGDDGPADTYTCSGIANIIEDYIYIAVGNGTTPTTPYEQYNILTLQANRPSVVSVNATDNIITIKLQTTFTFSTGNYIRQVGIFLHTDSRSGIFVDWSGKNLLLYYVPLTNTIPVSGGQSVAVSIVISLLIPG